MSIFKKKLATIVAFSCVGVLCASFGASRLSFVNEPLKADAEIPSTATNVEDLITTVGTDVIGYAQQGGFSITQLNTLQAYKSATSGDTTTMYRTYISDKAEGEDDYSFSQYAGNLSYWSSYADNYAYIKTLLFPTTMSESVVSFRTVYQGQSLYLMGNMPKTPYASPTAGVGGWGFVVNSDHVALNAFYEQNTMATTTNFGKYMLETGKTLTAGDELLITYGATTATEGMTYYVKISKYADGTLTDILEQSTTSTQTIGTWSSAAANNTGNIHLAIGTSVKVPLILGGVEEPIFAGETVGEVTIEGEQVVGDALSTISSKLPDGYSFKDGTQEIVAGLGVYAVEGKYYEKTLNETSAFIKGTQNVINLEDKVGSKNNIDLSINGTYFNKSAAVWNDQTATYEDSNGSKYTYAYTVFDQKSDGSKLNNAYTSNADVAYNQNSYDGNASFWVSHTRSKDAAYSANSIGAGMNFNQTAVGDIVQFRLTYHPATLITFGLSNATATTNQLANIGGYHVDWRTMNNKINVGKKTSASATDYTSGLNPVDGLATSGWGLAQGDEVIVTFGVYNTVYNGTDTKGIVLKIEKANGTVLLDNNYIDTNPTTTYLKEGANSYFVSVWNHASYTPNNDVTLTIGGINKPIINKTTYTAPNLDGQEYATTEDQLLNTVETMADGYAFDNADTTKAIMGTNEYDGTYTCDDYYGKSYTLPIKITMTAKSLLRFNVVLNYANGQNYQTISLKEGETCALPTPTTDKTFIGWVNGEKLYNAGYVVENLEADVSYTLAEIEYKLADGASVRYKTDEYGNGGLRFVLLINKADYDAYKGYLSGFTGVIAPADEYIVEGAFKDSVYAQDFKGAIALDLLNNTVETVIEGTTYLQVPFALTNIKYSNFNRVFASMAYATVNYEGGSARIQTAYDAEKNARSIYERATDLLAEHYAAKYDGDIANTLSNEKVSILEAYVDQTVDIVIEKTEVEGTLSLKVEISDDETGISSEDRNAEGVFTDATLDEKEVKKIPYSVAASVSYSENVYTVTLTVKFDNKLGAEGFLSSVGSDSLYHVPVVVRVFNGTEYEVYRMSTIAESTVLYKTISYDEATSTATITFEYRG